MIKDEMKHEAARYYKIQYMTEYYKVAIHMF